MSGGIPLDVTVVDIAGTGHNIGCIVQVYGPITLTAETDDRGVAHFLLDTVGSYQIQAIELPEGYTSSTSAVSLSQISATLNISNYTLIDRTEISQFGGSHPVWMITKAYIPQEIFDMGYEWDELSVCLIKFADKTKKGIKPLKWYVDDPDTAESKGGYFSFSSLGGDVGGRFAESGITNLEWGLGVLKESDDSVIAIYRTTFNNP